MRTVVLVVLVLFLTACSSQSDPPGEPAPVDVPVNAEPTPTPSSPPTVAIRPVPEVLARPVQGDGPQRITFAAGDVVNQAGVYFLNVESGTGEAWIYPSDAPGLLIRTISADNGFVVASIEKEGYLIDRQAGAVWRWDVDAVRPLLSSDHGFLFAEMNRDGSNLRETGRYIWTDQSFKPAGVFVLEGEQFWTSHAMLSPDGQQVALLGQRRHLTLEILDLGSGSHRSLEVARSGSWVGSGNLVARDGALEISLWVNVGNPNVASWNEVIRRYDWQGQVIGDIRIPGNYTFFSPDGRWVAWQEQELLGGLAPVTVVADAATLQPHLKVLGATPCFAALGSGGTRWLADSSGLVLATTDNRYRVLTLEGKLAELPGFADLSWKGEPQPAPDRSDRFALGRLEVVDGTRHLQVTLEGFVTPRGADAWGDSSRELRFLLPPKAGHGACQELPAMEMRVLPGDEPMPEFPLVVRPGGCLPLLDAGKEVACLPEGARLGPLPEWNCRPGLIWWRGTWSLYVQTESGQTGWIDLEGGPVTWAE